MTPAIFTVPLETPAREVIRRMLQLKVHHLFVVDEELALVGVISPLDVLRHLGRRRLIMYRSILVPLDGSLASEQSLPYAAALARRSGAALQLVYVHTPLILGEGTMYLGTPDVQLWEEEKKYVLSVVNRLKKMGVEKVSAQVLEGPIAETLQEQALGEGCDLVVMTTHGRGPVSRFWLGSVADQLVHRLPIPLLLDPHAGGSAVASCGTGSPQYTGGPGRHAGGGANAGTGRNAGEVAGGLLHVAAGGAHQSA